MFNFFKFLIIASLSSVFVACGGGSDNLERKYAGKVTETNAYVGIVENGSKIIAYVCDGNNISQWFDGEFSQAGESILESGGQILTLQSTSKGFEGNFEKDGVRKSFVANPIASSSEAGVYRADVPIDEQSIIGGWVVLEDQTRRGLVTFGGTTLSTSGFNLSTSSVQVTSTSFTSSVSINPVTTTSVTCRFSGIITRSSGAVVPGVRVRILDASTVPERLIGEATTDSRGNYSLSINQSTSTLIKTYRILVINSSGQTIAQTTARTTCGANTNLTIP